MAIKKKGGLGKGLDALIPKGDKESKASDKGVGTANSYLEIIKVEPNRDQPRKKFDEDSLVELSESIKQHGVLEPLIVVPKDDYYMIVAGERRWRAAKMAGLAQVPVIIRELNEQQILEISLIENLQREDLNPIEEALAYKKLIDDLHMKQDEVAERVSKSRAAVTNSMRLLKLDARVQEMLIDDLISAGHARAILGISDNDRQYEFAQRVMDQKMSVRDVEKEIKRIQREEEEIKAGKRDEQPEALDPKLVAILAEQQEKLKGILGTKVVINAKSSSRGKVEIEYYSADDLDVLIGKLESLA
ncbi:MAG: ParB/RepB/Spo0J family partition protein [Lachnospiraceae bacterium]|nr:ParB/RepB/Spo0J family partition protein [Lachnospiraceae bacterium]